MFDVSLLVQFYVSVLVYCEHCQPTWDYLSQVSQVSLNSLYRRGRINYRIELAGYFRGANTLQLAVLMNFFSCDHHKNTTAGYKLLGYS